MGTPGAGLGGATDADHHRRIDTVVHVPRGPDEAHQPPRTPEDPANQTCGKTREATVSGLAVSAGFGSIYGARAGAAAAADYTGPRHLPFWQAQGTADYTGPKSKWHRL